MKRDDKMKKDAMKKHARVKRHATISFCVFVIVFSLCSTNCGDGSGGGKSGPVTIAVDSFRQNNGGALQVRPAGAVLPAFVKVPDYLAGYINSGPPDYVIVTLQAIYLEAPGESALIWEGEKALLLDGSDLDLADLNSELGQVPVGTYSNLKIHLDTTARIKGTLTGMFDMDGDEGGLEQELTVYTKDALAYDPYTHTGGGNDYTAFTAGPAEEMSVGIGTEADTLVIESEYEIAVTEASNPTITILFDLNRMLRFYNGLHPDPNHGGVGPDDPTDRAYFFAHSVFADSLGVFIGDAGRIEGYQALYANYDGDVGVGTPAGVKAWMTLVFDSGDNFLSGHLIGDDDNALTVAKGIISAYTVRQDGLVDFSYELNHGLTVYYLEGFERQDTLLERSATALYDSDNQAGSFEGHGEAEFILQHVQ